MRSGRGVRLSVIRRIVAIYAAVSVGFFAVTPPAFAALPALVLAEPAANLLAGLVVQTIGRQAVMTVGVAANDASWVSFLSVAMRTMGILRVVGAGSTVYEFPLQADAEVPPVPPAAGAYGTTPGNPLVWNDPSLRVISSAAMGPYQGVGSGSSVDAQNHFVPNGTYTVEAFRTAFIALWAQYGAGVEDAWFEAVPGGTPIAVTDVQGTTWYIQPMRAIVMIGEEESLQFQSHGSYYSVESPGDGVKRFKISSGGYVADPNDTDWTAAEKAAIANPSRIQFKDANSNAVEVTRTQAGTLIVGAAKASADSVKVRQVKLDDAAKPLSVTEETTLAAEPSSVADAAAVAAAAGTGTGTGAGTGTGTWPDDYARQNTLQSVDAGVAQIHLDLTRTENVDDPTQPDSARFTESFFSGTFDSLKGWQLPGHSSQCPVGSFSWNSTSYAIDAHCQLVNNHFNALQAAMTVVWSLLALFIVLRA